MALSMMVEKESGRVEGNEFGTLWRQIVDRDGAVRYLATRMSGLFYREIIAFLP